MADEDDSQKTEEPTQRRRDEARKQGQIAQSADLTGSLQLLAALIAIWLNGGVMLQQLRTATSVYIGGSYGAIERVGGLVMVQDAVARGLAVVGGFIACMFVIAALVSVAQVGIYFSPEALEFKFDRLNPISGFGKIVSLQGAVKGLQQCLKIVVVGVITSWLLWGREGFIASFAGSPLPWVASTSWDIAMKMLFATTLFLVGLGGADYFFQLYRTENQLKMSKQELKDEHKNEEGDPLVRSRRRQLQRELAMKRKMMDELPKATVVITNPTHFAIALRYDSKDTPAPTCIAKGQDRFALQIIEEARRLKIPVMERKPLARALFKTVNVGDEIPSTLYLAVSEVLAHVWRQKHGIADLTNSSVG